MDNVFLKPAARFIDRVRYGGKNADDERDILIQGMDRINARWVGQLCALSEDDMVRASQPFGWPGSLTRAVVAELPVRRWDAKKEMGFDDRSFSFPQDEAEARRLLGAFLTHGPRPIWSRHVGTTLSERYIHDVIGSILTAAKGSEPLMQTLEQTFNASVAAMESGRFRKPKPVVPGAPRLLIEGLDLGVMERGRLIEKFGQHKFELIVQKTLQKIDPAARREVRRQIAALGAKELVF